MAQLPCHPVGTETSPLAVPSCSPASGGLPHGQHPPRSSWPGPVPYTLGCVSPCPELISRPWVPFATCTPDVFLCTLEGCFCLPGNHGPAPIWATLETSLLSNGLQPGFSIDLSPNFRKEANRQACLPWKLSLSQRVFLSVLWLLECSYFLLELIILYSKCFLFKLLCDFCLLVGS